MTEVLLSSFVGRSPSATLLLELNTSAPPSVESSPLHNSHLGGQGSSLTSRRRQRLCPLPVGEAADGEGARRWCRSGAGPQAPAPGRRPDRPRPPAGRRGGGPPPGPVPLSAARQSHFGPSPGPGNSCSQGHRSCEPQERDTRWLTTPHPVKPRPRHRARGSPPASPIQAFARGQPATNGNPGSER